MRAILTAALILSAAPLWSHEGHKHESAEPTPHEMAKKKAEHMEKELKLNPDQKQKVHKLLEDSMTEMQELSKKLKFVERETNEKIRVLLNDEQKEKFDMLRARMKMMQGPHGMGGPQGMGPGGEGMGPGGQGMRPGGMGMRPGGKGMRPGGMGMRPGGQGMRPGGMGTGPGEKGMGPGEPGMAPGGAGGEAPQEPRQPMPEGEGTDEGE